MAQKYNEDVQYTQEELAEIERIASVLPGAPVARVKKTEEPAEKVEDITSMVQIQEDTDEQGFADEFAGFGDLGSTAQAEPEFAADDEFPSFGENVSPAESDLTGSFDFSEEPSTPSSDDIFSSADFQPLDSFDDNAAGDSSLGFDDSVSEPSSFEQPAPEAASQGSFANIKDKILSKFKKKPDRSTTSGQIESLIEDEPLSVDEQDISRDAFLGEEPSASFDESSLEDISSSTSGFGEMPAASNQEDSFGGLALDGGADFGGPDLSDLDLASSGPSMEEADISEIPQMDFGSFHEESVSPSAGISLDDELVSSDLGMDIPKIDNIDQIDSVVRTERPAMASMNYEQPEDSDALDLTVHEMKKFKGALKLMPAGLIRAVKEALLNDRLSAQDANDLVNMILDGVHDVEVQGFLEEKLGMPIDMHDEGAARRKIFARDEYTSEGRERQKALFRKTRNFTIVAVVVAVLGVVSYEYVYKPFMAKHLINQGVELIRRNADPKTEDYVKAEELFRKVDEKYAENYLYGYNAYGRAYFDKREFDRSLDKLNRGYKIAEAGGFVEYDILNSLGYFYSKVPPRFFAEVKPLLKKYYYEHTKPIGSVDTQLDVAIDFYKKANNRNPKDTTSLYGIGNAYFYQGQYLKARKFFEDILRIDPDSVVGHAGLFNLFIETDNFPETMELYVNIRDKDMLPEFPSPLLAKLAWYVMEKKADEKNNIRIAYGVQSPRLKDSDDNPFPVVQDVLKSLMKKDSSYPPLYLMYGKLSILQRNYKLAEKYFKTAIEYSDDRSQKYFAALHMLGEFYYMTKDPVKSYNYLHKAEAAYETPADFTYDEFYRETENIGKTYAIEGNIFYYFFDKIKFTSSDLDSLEDEDVDKLEEKMENYTLAQGKYEKALESGYKSSELHYNLGRIFYMNRSYEQSLGQWMNLFDDFTRSPELMFSLGNVFYKLNNLDSAKAQYSKIIAVFEIESSRIRKVNSRSTDHIKIYRTLSAAYNNLGVVYQVQHDESKSGVSYWKSIENAQMLGEENEFARMNIGRLNRASSDDASPVVDDNIPYSLDIYREDMRI